MSVTKIRRTLGWKPPSVLKTVYSKTLNGTSGIRTWWEMILFSVKTYRRYFTRPLREEIA